MLLGLVEAFADPELVALLNTVSDAREQCPLDFWTSDLFSAAVGTLVCPPSSPTMVLLERLQLVGIGVLPDGSWSDAVGVFRPWQLGHAELCLRLQWAWQKYVAAQVAHRRDFQGLEEVDTTTTRRAIDALQPDQQALLRLGLSGGLFTQNADSHWNGESDRCKWCGQPDSLEHRYFQCPQFADIRGTCAPAATQLRPLLPNALALRGWALHSPTHHRWCRLLDLIPTSVPPLECALDPFGWNHVFTDGSCLWQNQPGYRVAAWGAVLATGLSDSWTCSINGLLGAGHLPGLCQTSYRAELFALGFVLHHAAQGGLRVKIYSDCLGVVNKFHMLTQGCRRLKTTSSSADLWQWVQDSMTRLGQDKVQLVKIAAHRKLSSARTKREFWEFWNNAAADRIAKTANHRRDKAFWDFWETHARCVTGAAEIHRQVVALHVAIGLRSVEAENEQTLDEVTLEAPAPNRDFPMQFQISAWDGTTPQDLALEYGQGMAKRVQCGGLREESMPQAMHQLG